MNSARNGGQESIEGTDRTERVPSRRNDDEGGGTDRGVDSVLFERRTP